MRVKCILLLRHPVELSISEYANKDEWMLGTRGRNFRFIPKYIRSFDHLVNETARIWKLKREQLERFTAVHERDERSAWGAFKQRGRGGENLFKCKLAMRPRQCFAPVIYQSWYDVFLLWRRTQPKAACASSLATTSTATRRAPCRASPPAGPPPQAYDVSYVKNNHAARGVIAAEQHADEGDVDGHVPERRVGARPRAGGDAAEHRRHARAALADWLHDAARVARPVRPCRSAPAPADAALAKRSR